MKGIITNSAEASATHGPAEMRVVERRVRIVPGLLFGSVLLHVFLAVLATFWVVAVFRPAREQTFRGAPQTNSASTNALEHRIKQGRARSLAAAPTAVRCVMTTSATALALPALPAMPQSASAVRPTTISGAGGFGAGPFGWGGGNGNWNDNGGGGGGGGGGGTLNFFGLHDAAGSVVVMIDVSDSMFTRTGDADGSARKLVKHGKEQSFQTVRDEAIRLIQSLTPGTRFGIVRWAGSAGAWKPTLVPASETNKTTACAHIQDEVDYKSSPPQAGRPGGTRHDYALEEAFSLKPEVIYMLTDGNATAALPGGGLRNIPADDIWKAAETGQKNRTDASLPPTRINVVYYLSGADKAAERQMLTGLASRNGGRFTTVEAKGRKQR